MRQILPGYLPGYANGSQPQPGFLNRLKLAFQNSAFQQQRIRIGTLIKVWLAAKFYSSIKFMERNIQSVNCDTLRCFTILEFFAYRDSSKKLKIY